MTRSLQIYVTEDHIDACVVVHDIGDGFRSTHPDSKDPVELAIAEATGQDTILDSDVPDGEMATIGQERNTLVANLPPEVTTFIDRYYRGEHVEPFTFALEIEDWLYGLVTRAVPE